MRHPISKCLAICGLMFAIPLSQPAYSQSPLGDESTTIAPSAVAKAKQLLLDEISGGRVAGGAHLVMVNGTTVYFQSAGKREIEDDLPFEKDTIVRIYSMTKPVTSVAAMILFDQGKFQLDDPVAKFIPEFAATKVLVKDGQETKVVPAERPITVRDVLCHSTGYSYGDGTPAAREYYEKEQLRYRDPVGMYPPRMSIEQAAARLARIPAHHHPGKQFTYGFNTDLLGRLVEIWSGQSLDKFLQQAIFVPLEMPDTGFSVSPDKRHRFASCYTYREGKQQVVDKAASSEFGEGFDFLSGGGGLVSTIQDYANFCQMLVAEGRFHDRQLLKPETIQLMFTDQLNGHSGPFQFGLGFAIGEVKLGSGESARTAKEYAWAGYASTDFRIVPEEKIIQIFVRQQVPSDHALASQLFPCIYAGLK